MFNFGSPGSTGRTESYNSMMQEDMNSGGLNSSQIQRDWSPKSFTSSADQDFSIEQQRLNPVVNGSGNSTATCFSTGFSMEPSSASYGYPSTLIQSLFEPDPQPQHHQQQSLFNNRSMNFLSSTTPNYGTNIMSELSSPSWPNKVSSFIKSSLPKQQPIGLHLSNNTPCWNASATSAMNDIRASFLPSLQSQFIVPDFEEKPNCPSLTTKVKIDD